MFLPPAIIPVLAAFQPAFTRPTFTKVRLLVVGALLTRGRHTVAAALRSMGVQRQRGWSKYHHVLNRARWSPLLVSRILLKLVVMTFPSPDQVVKIVIDETLERRWGPKIAKRGHWRDSRLSSHQMNVTTSGLRWVVMAVIVTPPWTRRSWALPFLSVLATTPKVSQQLHTRHKTVPRLAQQMVKLVRRWVPDLPIQVVGDSAYSVLDLGTVCHTAQVTLIAPLRLDARLFAPPPAAKARTGRPRIVGARLPTLQAILTDTHTRWDAVPIPWYGGTCTTLDVVSGTALWYSTGLKPLPIRWVLIRDRQGQAVSRAFFATDAAHSAAAIIAAFVQRWCLEVTFEEGHAHLGLETQRQWSDKAIDRCTPVVLGLFSVTTLLGQALYPAGDIPLQQAAWYCKQQASSVTSWWRSDARCGATLVSRLHPLTVIW
ncbi:MAG: hypothetical protein NVS4B2_34620 [Chloroflexota bacterium]